MKFNIIVAVDEKLGIGKNNALPWRLPADLKFFKQITMKAESGKRNAVIMGRKTWDSLPAKAKPLPGRLNIIVSRQEALDLPEGCLLAGSLDAALSFCNQDQLSEVFLIGGAQLFETGLTHPELKTVYLTEIYKDYQCDCFFPDYKDKLVLLPGAKREKDNELEYAFKVLEPVNLLLAK